VDSSQPLRLFEHDFSMIYTQSQIGETDALCRHVEPNERQEAGKYDKDFHSLDFGSLHGIWSGPGANCAGAPNSGTRAGGLAG
jgi:hypothetical protein